MSVIIWELRCHNAFQNFCGRYASGTNQTNCLTEYSLLLHRTWTVCGILTSVFSCLT